MTSNPAQRHLESFQDKLRKARCERKDQDPEENTTNIRRGVDGSPPTTSRAARASFKPRIIEDNTPTPMDTYSNPQKSTSDYHSKSLTQRVENIEKKIDNLMELLFKCLEYTKEPTIAHLITS
ncbi:GD25841 [Drosophila simulans]|uniref:GD25841 n=1 Tax=Drosophila simulans TaxID=7240 RepID=B4NV45_DROSI|nr:GD25841 [Drosophila simulans]